MKLLSAAPTRVQNCKTGEANAFQSSNNPECLTTLPQVAANNAQLRNGLGIIFGIAAAIALISLAVAALNFATAATDTEKISRSKQAIVFSLLGLVISLSAEVLVLTLIDKI